VVPDPRPVLDVASTVRSERRLRRHRLRRAVLAAIAFFAVVGSVGAVIVGLLGLDDGAQHQRAAPTITHPSTGPNQMPLNPRNAPSEPPTTVTTPPDLLPATPSPGSASEPSIASAPSPKSPAAQGLYSEPIAGGGASPAPTDQGSGGSVDASEVAAASIGAAQQIAVTVPCVEPDLQHCPPSEAVQQGMFRPRLGRPRGAIVLLSLPFGLQGAARRRRRATPI
jgi:hypothetical protein